MNANTQLSIPRLEMAKQILRYGDGAWDFTCIEKYTPSEFKMKAPELLCVMRFPEQTRLYPKSQLEWAWTAFQYLKRMVSDMWNGEEKTTTIASDTELLCKHIWRQRTGIKLDSDLGSAIPEAFQDLLDNKYRVAR